MRAFEFEMTAERAFAAEEPLRRVLWAQLEARERWMAPKRGLVRGVAMGINTVAVGLSIYGFVLSHDGVYGAWLATFLVTALVFYELPRLTGAVQGWARRSLGRTAGRMLERAAKAAPYRIGYVLEPDRLLVDAAQVGVRYEVAFRGVRRVIVSEWVVCLFERRFSAIPTRVLHARDEEDREAVVAAFSSAGAEVLRVPAEVSRAAA